MVSDRIAIATIRTVFAKISGPTFGRMWRVTRPEVLRAQRARTLDVAPGLQRQHLRADHARRTRPRRDADDEDDRCRATVPGSRTARSRAAGTGSPGTSRSAASDRSRSTRRSSRRRARCRCPITTVMSVAARPTISETRDPQIVSESTDRPWLSVPNQNCEFGGWQRAGSSGWQIGERSHLLASSGAKIGDEDEEDQDAQPDIPILFLPVLLPDPADASPCAASGRSPSGFDAPVGEPRSGRDVRASGRHVRPPSRAGRGRSRGGRRPGSRRSPRR